MASGVNCDTGFARDPISDMSKNTKDVWPRFMCVALASCTATPEPLLGATGRAAADTRAGAGFVGELLEQQLQMCADEIVGDDRRGG